MKKIVSMRGINRDPFVMKKDGLYYRCYKTAGSGGCSAVSIACVKKIEAFEYAEAKTVYEFEQGKPWSNEVWAPEIHVINGKCFLYAACDDGNNHNHRMYVLTNDSADPLDEYRLIGKIGDNSDCWAIDGTVMQFRGERYFIWSGWEGKENVAQNLYIAHMKDPCTIDSERVLISKPEFEWEKRGATGQAESPFINEGPFAFAYDGCQYLAYSASGSWCEDYCIALLKLIGDDPMKAENWIKQDRPLLSGNDMVKGSGHCSVIDEDGRLLMFFHAWDANETNIRWDTVSTWMAELVRTDDGFKAV